MKVARLGKASYPTWRRRQLYRQRGLEHFIHDGSKGLIAALNYLHPHVPHQRCAFHKLRNLRQSIHIPEALPSGQARQFKQRILQPIRASLRLKTVEKQQN